MKNHKTPGRRAGIRLEILGPGRLLLRGKTGSMLGIEGRVRYEAQVRVLNEGGTVVGRKGRREGRRRRRRDDAGRRRHELQDATTTLAPIPRRGSAMYLEHGRGKTVRPASRRSHRRAPAALSPRAVESARKRRPRCGPPTCGCASTIRARTRNWPRLMFQYGRYLLDRQQPARLPAGQPARHLERGHGPGLGQQVHDEHQPGDELLAGGSRRPCRSASNR